MWPRRRLLKVNKQKAAHVVERKAAQVTWKKASRVAEKKASQMIVKKVVHVAQSKAAQRGAERGECRELNHASVERNIRNTKEKTKSIADCEDREASDLLSSYHFCKVSSFSVQINKAATWTKRQPEGF